MQLFVETTELCHEHGGVGFPETPKVRLKTPNNPRIHLETLHFMLPERRRFVSGLVQSPVSHLFRGPTLNSQTLASVLLQPYADRLRGASDYSGQA